MACESFILLRKDTQTEVGYTVHIGRVPLYPVKYRAVDFLKEFVHGRVQFGA